MGVKRKPLKRIKHCELLPVLVSEDFLDFYKKVLMVFIKKGTPYHYDCLRRRYALNVGCTIEEIKAEVNKEALMLFKNIPSLVFKK